MDFSFTEDQEALSGLAKQILEDRATHERLKEVEATDDRVDWDLWAQLAKSNILGIAVPEDAGGSGLGLIEIALVLEQAGRTVAPVPLLPTLVMGALPVARFGTPRQRQDLLSPVAAGDLVLSAALVEPGGDPSSPSTEARREGSCWVLSGTKTCVPAGMSAGRILVPARTGPGSTGVFLVDPSARGVSLSRQVTTGGRIDAQMALSDVEVGDDAVLGDPLAGSEVLDWILERSTAALCALAVGVCEEALRLTAEYTKTREQFDRPIATFQAVGQRAADAYIDTEAVRLTAWQAVWRLSEGLPASEEVAVAKFWAAEGGQRVVHAAQHLHGGIGVDRDYPLHRYFLMAKEIELDLGGATRQLLRLGSLLASDPVRPA
jgi:alkylation response protein AidB-like acyl-CoA dehydrogenase